MKTTHFILALIMPVALILLWAAPILTSSELDAGWVAVEFCVLTGTYLMLAHPGLFSSMARSGRKITYSALA